MVAVSNGLIVGGGIAGLSASIALARIGVRCDVAETGDKPLGAGMTLSGGVIDALEELGLYAEASRTGTPLSREMFAPAMKDIDGRAIGPPPSRPQAPGAKPSIRVFRPAFADVLERAAEHLDVNVQKGLTIDSIEDRANDVLVQMSDGETRCYDFVIGADGVGSRTRSLIFPDAPTPAYAGQMCVHWLIPGPAIEGEGWFVAGEGARLGFFHLPHQNAIYAPIVISMQERRVSQDEAYEMVKRVLDKFSAPPIVALRRRLNVNSTLICRPFHWILMPRPWFRGRTLLIGDAAHATTAHIGMGGGMAVEDAVVIAQCLATANSLPDAYAAFMSRRFERVRLVVETSITLSKLEQDGAQGLDPSLMSSAYSVLAQPY